MYLARALACRPPHAQKPGMGGRQPGSPRVSFGDNAAAGLCCGQASYYRPRVRFPPGSSQAELYIWQHLGAEPLWAPSTFSFPICKMGITIVTPQGGRGHLMCFPKVQFLVCPLMPFTVATNCLYRMCLPCINYHLEKSSLWTLRGFNKIIYLIFLSTDPLLKDFH